MNLENKSNEIWRNVIILDERVDKYYYYNMYKVSNIGRIARIDNNGNIKRILKPITHSKGYLRVVLSNKNNKLTFRIHRLVAFAFMEDSYFTEAIVDHINGIRIDNNVSNLKWADYKDNMNNNLTKSKISENNKFKSKVLCVTTNIIFNSIVEASSYYNVNVSSISCCCRGIQKSAGTLNGEKLVWRYLED